MIPKTWQGILGLTLGVIAGVSLLMGYLLFFYA